MKIQCARFLYFYSFVLSENPVELVRGYARELGLKVHRAPDEHFTPYAAMANTTLVVSPTAPLAGVPASLTLCIKRRTPEPPFEVKVRLSRRFHLDRSGACGYVIECDVVRKQKVALTSRELILLSNAGDAKDLQLWWKPGKDFPLRQIELPTETGTTRGNSLFRLFVADVGSMVDRLAGFKHPPRWLDDPRRQNPDVDAIGRLPGQPLVSSQAPYVATVVYFDDANEFHRYYPGHASEDGLKEVAALLLRWKVDRKDAWSDVDLSHLRDTHAAENGIVPNLTVHRDIFLTAHLRSCLALANVSDRAEHEAGNASTIDAFTRDALEQTLSEARARWFAYVIMSAIVENEVERTLAAVLEDPAKLDRLIKIRTLLLRAFDSTISHKLSSGTFAGLYRLTSGIFGIPELRRQVLAKLELFDGLLTNSRQLAFANRPRE